MTFSCRTDKAKVIDIPNFSALGDGSYRGGQPTEKGWDYLKSLGVTTVVKLNLESEASDSYATNIGMTLFYEPISMEQQIGFKSIGNKVEPNSKQWFENILIAIPTNTYIHCEHGQDRTGLFCAQYRIRFFGWSKEQAEKEMLANGFHKELLGLWSYWLNYKETVKQ